MGQIASISPKGIIRNTPDSSSVDGSLLEAINIRFRDGAWRGVGEKQATGYHADSVFILDGITYHPALPVNTYVVHNQADNKIYTVLFTNGSAVQVSTAVLTMETGEVFSRFSHLGNVLFVFTDRRKYLLYWDKNTSSYKDLTFLPVPIVNVGDVASEKVDIDYIGAPVDLDPIPDYGLGSDNMNEYEYYRNIMVGQYLKKKTEKQAENLIEGYVIVRLAYRLFDGSYILHSQPYIHHIGHKSTQEVIISGVATALPFFRLNVTTLSLENNMFAKLAVYYNFFNTGTFSLPDYSSLGVIESLDVFCSRPIAGFDYSKSIDKWGELGTTTGNLSYYASAPFNSEFIPKIVEEPLYKVHSILIKDIVSKADHQNGTYGSYYYAKAGVVIPDMKIDVSTNELLPIDNLTHHHINSLADYQYNSRLHLGNINSTISSGFNSLYHSLFMTNIGPGRNGYAQSWDIINNAPNRAFMLGSYATESGLASSVIKIYQQVWLKAADGVKVITSEVNNSFVASFDANNIPVTFNYYSYVDGVHRAIIFNPMISYPDYRAFKIRYYYTEGILNTKHFLIDYELKPLLVHNIAYYMPSLVDNDGSTGMFYPTKLLLPDDLTTASPMPADSPTDDYIIRDTNRMQVSEIFNPFIWPALNSYRFGLIHNEVIDISTVQSQMSDSAFGMYPLYVFTRSGVYAIEHGTGEVLYQSIQPLNNEILIARGSLCAISGSIVFACKEGIRVITGSNKPEEISIPAEGSINNPLALLPYYYDALTGFRLPLINNYRTNATFLTYIQAAKIFYDVENKEIIVSNPAYNYSYAYSLFTDSWATRTDTFTDTLVISGRQIAVKRSSAMDGDILVYTSSLHYLDTEDATTGLCDYMLMQTRPLNLSNSSNKHLNKIISRCRVITKNQENAIQIIAGSNDLITWQIISYVQYSGYQSNMTNTNPSGNFKYFIIAIAGERKGFYLNQIDMDWKERFATKLR